MKSLLIRALAVGVLLVGCLIWSAPVVAAENPFIRDIQARGVLRVGLPDLNTPPAYYCFKRNFNEFFLSKKAFFRFSR